MKYVFQRKDLICLGLLACFVFASCTSNNGASQNAVTTATPTTPLIKSSNQGSRSGMSFGSFASVSPTYKDVAYADQSSSQKLDIYIPSDGNSSFPVVLMIHGGGFMFGDKADGTGLSGTDALLAAGYAVASINYRLSGEAKYPAQIYDAKTAVRYLRAHASEYNLNPEKIGAWGASAGGNLAALLGTTCGVTDLEGIDLDNKDQSSCVQAVVDWFGPIDFLKMDEQFAGTSCPQTHNDANSPESMLVGAAIQTVPEMVNMTNPMNYIDNEDAPFFIQHGSADCNIPPVQGKFLADALIKAIGADEVTYSLLDGAGHGGDQFAATENTASIIAFLDKYIK